HLTITNRIDDRFLLGSGSSEGSPGQRLPRKFFRQANELAGFLNLLLKRFTSEPPSHFRFHFYSRQWRSCIPGERPSHERPDIPSHLRFVLPPRSNHARLRIAPENSSTTGGRPGLHSRALAGLHRCQFVGSSKKIGKWNL